jgi:ribosomal protein S5
VVELVGIRDLLTKSFGSSNKVNTAYATILALSGLKAIPRREPLPAPKPRSKSKVEAGKK